MNDSSVLFLRQNLRAPLMVRVKLMRLLWREKRRPAEEAERRITALTCMDLTHSGAGAGAGNHITSTLRFTSFRILYIAYTSAITSEIQKAYQTALIPQKLPMSQASGIRGINCRRKAPIMFV